MPFNDFEGIDFDAEAVKKDRERRRAEFEKQVADYRKQQNEKVNHLISDTLNLIMDHDNGRRKLIYEDLVNLVTEVKRIYNINH